MTNSPKSILITGGNGNIARLLAKRLADDGHSLTCLDIVAPDANDQIAGVDYHTSDICDEAYLETILAIRKPDIIFHLASLLSGSSEIDRPRAFRINALATFNLFELALKHGLPQIVFPGTGASYGPDVPATLPEDHPQWPENIYGVTKIANERLGNYYKAKHGLDFRCLRPPLVLSPFAPTSALTAYASHAYVAAHEGRAFAFPVSPNIGMSSIFIGDLVEGFVKLAFADKDSLTQPAYNLHALCPTAQEIADSISKYYPNFKYNFKPDETVEKLLRTAPNIFEDAGARRDWGWDPISDLDTCSEKMFELLSKR